MKSTVKTVSMKGVGMGVPGIQGDVAFIRVAELPEGLTVAESEKGLLVVAHSETGHNHAVVEDEAVLYNDPNDPLQAYMVVKDSADVVHHRSYDTHKTVNLDPGIYRIKRQQEYTPEGLRRVAD